MSAAPGPSSVLVYTIDGRDRIDSIEGDWDAFALDNGAPDLIRDQVLGNSIWQFIEGLEAAAARPRVEVFHAGTGERDGRIVASSGRVLNVCATGADLREALREAYAAAAEISWPHKVLRSDIGRRVLL